ncbi:MAG: amino acid ABC transporter permease [Nitrospiraceae bacterium]|nr:MAG: amino acid ABC transporter permease [Nitrospiraceae bacterium]
MDLIEQLANLNFYLLGSYPRGSLGGLALNIIMALLAICLSFVFGVLLGYSRLSCRRYVKFPCIAYIETVRSTPLIMIIFWFYFFLPYLFGGNITVFWSAVISLCAYASAYEAEIVRAGIIAVPKGQLEAALSTGLSRYGAMRHVILPQAFKIMVPSFVSFFVSLFKDTSVTYIIGVIELTQAGIIISQRQPDRIFSAYFVVGLGFWIICFSMSRLARRLEKRIGVFDLESIRPEACRDEFMLLPKRKKAGAVLTGNPPCSPPGQ